MSEQPVHTMTRTFKASREKVFKVMTDPALVSKWWGPSYLTTTVDHCDFQVGGTWRYVQKDPEGNEFAFHGEYKAIEAPRTVSNTFEFEGMPGHIILEKVELEEENGVTILTATSQFENQEDYDAMLLTGMEEGAKETYDRLEALLAES